MNRPSWKIWLLVGLLAAPVGHAVDHSKFRTCEQGAFCRRYRKYVSKIEGSGGTTFAHAIDASSVKAEGNVVTAKLVNVQDPNVKPLDFSLSWYQDSAEGKCGIIRFHVTEEAPLHPRFQLKEGDVVVKETELQADVVTIDQSVEGATRITSAAPGSCEITLRHKPFELDFKANGKLLQQVNARHLMNFESYRAKGTQLAGTVDATAVDDKELWEEDFAGHHDSKPRGPAAVGVDISFADAGDIFGLASHATGLGLGETKFKEPYRFYNLDVFEYALDVPMALYGAIPLATAIHRWADGSAASASGFLFVNPSEGFVKVDPAPSGGGMMGFGGGSGGAQNTWWLFESGVVDAFFFAGPTTDAVLQQYHTVTGMPRLPPLATLGKHQSRWNYVDVEDSVNVNKKFDQNDIPYDVLWLDIEHTDGKKYFTWHPTHFAKPEILLDALAKSKRKLVTIVDPHIKREEGYDVFTTIRDKDLYTKTKSGTQYDGWCWPGTSFYPDFCNPDMRDQWAKFFAMDYYPHNRADLYTWNDMNEPSVFNGPEVTMPRDNLHKCHTEGYGVEHRDVHNVYGYYHHGATVQGHMERAPNVRPFVLTRSFFVGSHRHGAMWTGDNMARWDHLEKSVPMLLSLCLSGMSFAGADVPGFFYDPEVELFKRWHQLGIWYPFYRGHAHLETKRREPWMLGDEVTNMVRDQISVRYQMLPYWYTLFAEWAMAAKPIMRPLWYHNLDDAEAYKHQDKAFLVGEDILVHAISKAGQQKAGVYFPKGSQWFDFWDTKVAPVAGGQELSVALRPDRIPTYVRKGSILFKKMRRRRSSGAMVADPYTIFVYGGEAKGRLYLDDGDSHDYQKGAFVYDEFEFDGTVLRERPAPAFWGKFNPHSVVKSAGLPETPLRHLRVERIVFVGLPKQPTGVKIVPAPTNGEPDQFQVTSEKAADGSWVATVKKPACILSAQWSLELAFSVQV